MDQSEGRIEPWSYGGCMFWDEVAVGVCGLDLCVDSRVGEVYKIV